MSEQLPCREPECREPALGLDGYCIEHSRERERSGRWETIPLRAEVDETGGRVIDQAELLPQQEGER